VALDAGLYAARSISIFSGYSDMAVGLALSFGIRLPVNSARLTRPSRSSSSGGAWHITLVALFARLPLHSSWRQPARRTAPLYQFAGDDACSADSGTARPGILSSGAVCTGLISASIICGAHGAATARDIDAGESCCLGHHVLRRSWSSPGFFFRARTAARRMADAGQPVRDLRPAAPPMRRPESCA